MKKLLLIGINARFTHSNLALRYLRNSITDLVQQTELVEFSINQSILEILEQIVNKKPHILSFSVYIWNTEIVRNLLMEISKVLPHSKIILGGPEVSYAPEKWLSEFPLIDYIITGSGESGFRYLIENNFNHDNAIISKKNEHFSKITFPYLATDFPQIKDKYIYYESSRGCSFKCSYCLSSRTDQALELRDLKTVKKELQFLIEHKPKIIKFVDRTFNASKDHSREIWKFLINLNPKTTFHFEIHPELLNDEDIQILRSCPQGLFQFEIGIQSTNPQTLEAIHRKSSWEKASLMIKQLISLDTIHIHVDLIAGLPYESLKEFKKSFNNISNLQADHCQLGFLKILPGTEMAENVNKFEIAFTSTTPYIILKNKWLSFSELNKLHKIENLLNTLYNSKKYKMILKFLIPEFDSPYTFFNEYLKYVQARNFDLQTKNWQKNACELWGFINTNFADQDFFFDCMRWDWCLQANSHYYPEFLRSDTDRKAKQIGYEYLNSHKIKNKIKLDEFEMTISEFKKAIYFMPSSDKFKQQIINDHNIVIFVNGSSHYLNIT